MRHLFPVLLLILCILGMWIVVRGTYDYTRSKLPTVHQYDYIIEVDATDSVEIFHLYDNYHNEIGAFSNTDSLKTLINEDNM
jgi:hypothetical protein